MKLFLSVLCRMCVNKLSTPKHVITHALMTYALMTHALMTHVLMTHALIIHALKHNFSSRKFQHLPLTYNDSPRIELFTFFIEINMISERKHYKVRVL